jgi:hypothetical protein
MASPAVAPIIDNSGDIRSVATYEIIRMSENDGWTILHDGKEMETLGTRMAAFDATIAAAKTSILASHGVIIKLPHALAEPAEDAAEPATLALTL